MANSPVVHVIDDDDAIRDSLAFLLESAGIAVRTYSSATAFLDELRGTEVSCVVTDVRMPDIDGIALLQRLRDLGRNLPVIVMTGHAEVPLAVQAMKMGAVDFLEKPFNDEALLASIQAALDSQNANSRREAARAAGSCRIGKRPTQQSDRVRPQNQPPHGRDLPRKRHDQNERRQPFGLGAYGIACRPLRRRPGPCPSKTLIAAIERHGR
jgi:FixJ family two-component response regulator